MSSSSAAAGGRPCTSWKSCESPSRETPPPPPPPPPPRPPAKVAALACRSSAGAGGESRLVEPATAAQEADARLGRSHFASAAFATAAIDKDAAALKAAETGLPPPAGAVRSPLPSPLAHCRGGCCCGSGRSGSGRLGHLVIPDEADPVVRRRATAVAAVTTELFLINGGGCGVSGGGRSIGAAADCGENAWLVEPACAITATFAATAAVLCRRAVRAEPLDISKGGGGMLVSPTGSGGL